MSNTSVSPLPSSPVASQDSLAYSLLQRSLGEAAQGQLEFALVSCRQALMLAPQSFPAHSLHSMLLRRLAHLEKALAASKAALSISPQNQLERARFIELKTALQNNQKECVVGVDQWQAFVREVEASTPVSALTVSPAQIPAANASPRSQPAPISNRSLLLGGFVVVVLMLAFLTAREMRLAATKMAAGTTANVQAPPVNVAQNPNEVIPGQVGSTPEVTNAAGESVGVNATEPTAPVATETAPAPDNDAAPRVINPPIAPQNAAGPADNTAPPQVAPRTAVPQAPIARRTIPAAPPRVYSVPATPSAPVEQRNEIAPRVPQPAAGDAVGPRFSNP